VAVDPPPRVDHAPFLSDLGSGLPACDALDVGLVLREHAADADLGIPRAINVLRGDLDPVPAIVRLDQQGAPSRRLIVSPLWCWRQRQTRRTQFVALGLVLFRRLHEREGAPAGPADAAVGEGHLFDHLVRSQQGALVEDQFDVAGHGESITSWNAASRVIQRTNRSPHSQSSAIKKPVAESQSGAWIPRVPHDRWPSINRANSRNPTVGPAGNNVIEGPHANPLPYRCAGRPSTALSSRLL